MNLRRSGKGNRIHQLVSDVERDKRIQLPGKYRNRDAATANLGEVMSSLLGNGCSGLPQDFIVQYQSVDKCGAALRKAVPLWADSKTVRYAFGTLFRDSDFVIAWSEHHLARFSALSPGVQRKGLVIPPPPLIPNVPPG
jgi:hypothetical protein